MKYIEKETGETKTLEEIKKEYFEIYSNTDFKKEGISRWNTLEEFLLDCYAIEN